MTACGGPPRSKIAMSDSGLAALRAAVDEAGWIDDPVAMAPYLHEWRGRVQGAALAVVRPTATDQVAAIVRAASENDIKLVPQGGNTGLAGGSIPYPGERAVVLSLQRLDKIRDLDPLDYSVSVESGCILSTLQRAADDADRLFPLSLGSENSCTVGGLLSTNAGGTMTIRYGNMRELVLGVEIVLPNGEIWNGLRRLHKDNTGYDLKHLFIGAEGTLGIVTAAVLKLFPKPRQTETVFVAVPDPNAAILLLSRVRSATGDAVSAFELIPRIALDFALRHVAGAVDPLLASYPWYVLIEATAGVAGSTLEDAMETALASAVEAGEALDAAFSRSEAQRKSLWFIREAIVEAQRFEGGSIKHDVSVPVSRIAEFIARASQAVEAVLPGIRPIPFGHVGDGNVHFNLTQPVEAETRAYLEQWHMLNRVVHDVALSLGGSISAEHGIGRFRRDELTRVKDPVELDLMRRVKNAIDPGNLMNPDVMLPK